MEIESWLEWYRHPATQRMWDIMKARRSALQESWAAGAFTHESTEGTAQQNAKALGKVQQLEELMELIYDDFYGEQ